MKKLQQTVSKIMEKMFPYPALILVIIIGIYVGETNNNVEVQVTVQTTTKK